MCIVKLGEEGTGYHIYVILELQLPVRRTSHEINPKYYTLVDLWLVIICWEYDGS